MKKFWKNLCACSLAVACGINMAGCKDKKESSRDLDGDGTISAWETLFGSDSVFDTDTSSVKGTIVNISTADELKAIGNAENVDDRKLYILQSDIDLGGEEVCINLGMSGLYGGGHVIKNFKFGTINPESINLNTLEVTEDTDYGVYTDMSVHCLFYNGTGVNGVRLFAGMQSVNIDKDLNNEYVSISPFFNVASLSEIEVKGRIDINGTSNTSGRVNAQVDCSLLYSGKAVNKTESSEGNENVTTDVVENDVEISDVIIEGVISINDQVNSKINSAIGAIASRLTKNSAIFHSRADVDIVGTCSDKVNYIGGIVGHNLGFVSTVNYRGSIKLNNDIQNLYSHEYVGGIVGLNGVLAEIKNCRTTSPIEIVNKSLNSNPCDVTFHLGGIAGVNKGGVITLCESGAQLTLSNHFSSAGAVSNKTMGAICGYNNQGVISYNICKGSLNAYNVNQLSVAHVAGYSTKGSFDKVVTTTTINLDNLSTEFETAKLNLGMVTTFDYDYGYAKKDESYVLSTVGLMGINNSPYFSRILVDGKTTFGVGNYTSFKAGGVCDYNHGLRHDYMGVSGQDENSNYVFGSFTPVLFENLYYTQNCQLIRRDIVDGQDVVDTIPVSYVDEVKVFTNTPSALIEYLDFKNYLNHNEVSIGSSLILDDLSFYIGDGKFLSQSYFGNGKYNGELSYYDLKFEENHNHDDDSALGYCNEDFEDEMFSFVYSLVSSNNGKPKEEYVIRMSDKALSETTGESFEDYIKQPSNLTARLISRIKNMCNCLSLNNTVSLLNVKGEVITENNSQDDIKFVQITLEEDTQKETKAKFFMRIDVESFEKSTSSMFETDGEYIVYLTFKAL